MKLYHNPGWGSAIVEAQAAVLGMPCEVILAGEIYADPVARAVLGRVNPLVQVPTLVLDNGEVMTESAAITLYLSEVAGSPVLVPPSGDADRAAFLRWLIFIVANIYPCYTYCDVPERFVSATEGQAFQDKVTARCLDMWKVLAAESDRRGGPWVLGQRFTALDIYVLFMVKWRPRRAVFDREVPMMGRIADACAARPDLSGVMARNAE